MSIRAFIAGCAGTVLTPHEIAFFREANPWGLILFRRNVESPEQLLTLTSEFRHAVGRADAPVLIDQEGGRVQRMGQPHWRAYPPARRLGEIAANDPLTRRELTRLAGRLIAHDLLTVGITVDCLPVLDVPVPGAHGIIGDRAYAQDPETIAVLGRAAAEGLMAGGVLPVIKHMPGHGRAQADSHEALPTVETPLHELAVRDFAPFEILSDMPMAMTAHVVYAAIDPEAPATTSPKVFEQVIRGALAYDGLVMSDDISMKALSGTLAERAAAALRAGCDVALYCHGVMGEMEEVAAAVHDLSGDALRRAEAALARIHHRPEPLDPVEAWARLDAALAVSV
ncbi:beta-hexosaminidase [Alsobacter metallidurans]|uniref:beta-N-acetylhexosaminidase n=1 Tax=Alsobacter metallidurans TaxID=340221 RepID=A0A917MHR4_9HYPH|nr:beta-N-acetylhexosaminidase [Alsobacter metallidurans]GGH22016.1 beta-hexosaminidase [Alsobacter metallidurans]